MGSPSSESSSPQVGEREMDEHMVERALMETGCQKEITLSVEGPLKMKVGE